LNKYTFRFEMEGLTNFPGDIFLGESFWKKKFHELETNHESRSITDQAEGNSYFHKKKPYHWYLGQTWSGIFRGKIDDHEDKYSLIGEKRYNMRDVLYYQRDAFLQICSEIEFVILKSVVCPFMSFDNWNQSEYPAARSQPPGLKKKVDRHFYETNLEYRQAVLNRRQSNIASSSESQYISSNAPCALDSRNPKGVSSNAPCALDSRNPKGVSSNAPCALDTGFNKQEHETDSESETEHFPSCRLDCYYEFVLETQNFKLFAQVILDYNRKHRNQLDVLFQNLKSHEGSLTHADFYMKNLYEISSRHKLYFNTDMPTYIFVMKMLDYVAFKYYVAISNNYTTPDFERVYYDLVNEFMTLSCDESVALVDALYFVLDNYNFVYSEMGCIDDTYYDDIIYNNQTKYLYPFCQDNDLRNQVFEFVAFLLQQ
jgi:hypothetical protein